MKTRNKYSGQSLVEFALIFPIFFLLVMGLFDIGRAIFYYATLNTAVREGTRFAIVQPYCDYLSNPSSCSGSIMDPTYPLICKNAKSKANIAICNTITNKYFDVGELTSSTITIDHKVSLTNEPEIEIIIDYLFRPVTPGLALITNLPIKVNSQMLLTPIGQP